MRSIAAGGATLVPVLLTVLVVSAAAGVAAASMDARSPRAQTATEPETVFHVDIQRDGDARWTVSMHIPLDTADRRAGFERMRRDFENGTNTRLSVEPFVRAAELASGTTSRAMAVESVSRSSRITNDTGVLELSFTWRNFAVVDGDRLDLGDVFRTPDGTWLPELGENQVLVVEFPPGYSPVNLRWQVRDGAVYIEGPVAFEPGEPSATYAHTGSTPTPTPETPTPTPETPTPTGPGPSPTPTPGTGSALLPVVGLLLAIVVAGIAILAWQHEGGFPGGGEDSDGGPSSGGEAVASANGAGDSTQSVSDDGSSAAPPAESDPLLSDEERVLRLLADNEGRMKQAMIVEETDWSNAKVSQLLSEMAEEGQVEKLRIGRENLISLPDQGPDGVE